MTVLRSAVGVLLLASTGCAHTALSGSDLDRVGRPAFVSRIEDGAGPKSRVFRDDSSYGGKLKKLDAKEADRRLAVKLQSGTKDSSSGDQIPSITRFEIADGLRAETLNMLPRESPWTNVANPAAVASALESFLVEEVPANPPDFDLLKPLGIDAVVEIVVEDYGMRSDSGRAGAYIIGHARMFRLDGGGNLWKRAFVADEVTSQQPHVDPFKVAKDPGIFRAHINEMVKAISELFAKDLQPNARRGGPTLPAATELPEDSGPKKFQRKQGSNDDLPAPE